MSCRSGCKERNHSSYVECLRSARIRIGAEGHQDFKAVMSELNTYVDARRQGVQPLNTTTAATRYAMASSEKTGKAFDAAVDL